MNRKVVITGIGAITPLGNENAQITSRLLQGVSGAGPVTIFDPGNLPTRIAAEVKTLPTEGIGAKIRDRKVIFAIAAADEARKDAEQNGEPLHVYYKSPETKSSVSFGMGLELFLLPDMIELTKRERSGNLGAEAAQSFHPLTFLQTPSDICLHIISHREKLTHAPATLISACAASTDALGSAYKMIQSNQRDYMFVGGSDSMINPLGMGGFCLLQAVSRNNEDPAKASRPFDKNRDGFLLGEGAACFVLEEKNRAMERGAKIYAEIVGWGNSFDSHGITEPHPEGAGAQLAMQCALGDAGISPNDIIHVNAHGTSTPKNDAIETFAIKKVFGAHAQNITVNSTKSMIGHLISAAGAGETAATLLCARDGYLHPTINLETRDPDCDLDYIPEGKRKFSGGYIMKNSFGFGGQNSVVIYKI